MRQLFHIPQAQGTNPQIQMGQGVSILVHTFHKPTHHAVVEILGYFERQNFQAGKGYLETGLCGPKGAGGTKGGEIFEFDVQLLELLRVYLQELMQTAQVLTFNTRRRTQSSLAAALAQFLGGRGVDQIVAPRSLRKA